MISGITRFDLLFTKSTIDLFHKDNLELSPPAIKDILDQCKDIANPRPQYKYNKIIPHCYKKGNLMYKIIKTSNSLLEHMKIPITGKYQSKKKIKKFIQTQQYQTC